VAHRADSLGANPVLRVGSLAVKVVLGRTAPLKANTGKCNFPRLAG
jgi:hypothetical protein